MALVLSQPTVTSSATLLGTLVPGGTVTLLVPGSGSTVYVGTTSSVTTSNGFPCPSGGPQVEFTNPATGTAATLYGITASSQVIGCAFTTTA
jgi:hypothetical protein